MGTGCAQIRCHDLVTSGITANLIVRVGHALLSDNLSIVCRTVLRWRNAYCRHKHGENRRYLRAVCLNEVSAHVTRAYMLCSYCFDGGRVLHWGKRAHIDGLALTEKIRKFLSLSLSVKISEIWKGRCRLGDVLFLEPLQCSTACSCLIVYRHLHEGANFRNVW